MEKFDMDDLRQLIELTEYLKQKYPDVNIEITVSEAAPEEKLSAEQLQKRENALHDELFALKKELAEREEEFEELEDNMPDPALPEHLNWLLRCDEAEERIDDITARILQVKAELKEILVKLLNCSEEE